MPASQAFSGREGGRSGKDWRTGGSSERSRELESDMASNDRQELKFLCFIMFPDLTNLHVCTLGQTKKQI